ncbi:hypothetical protein TB2_045946 [Malus domestica]
MAKSPDNRITNKDAENGKKESKSRRSVEIKKVEDKNKRHVAFSKRKRGIFNKTAELSVLTGAETAAIVVLNSGKYSKKQIQDNEKASRLLKEEKILKGGKKSKSNNNGGDEGGCSYGWWETDWNDEYIGGVRRVQGSHEQIEAQCGDYLSFSFRPPSPRASTANSERYR